MNKPAKISNSKAVIAYLAQQFPECFTTEGEARPLKIGIFEDLADRLAEDENVSKTRLRSALRQYTGSWRYLKAVQAGRQRVDLDGAAAGEVEAEHAEHAKEVLKASKERARERRQKAQAGNGQRQRPQATGAAKTGAQQGAAKNSKLKSNSRRKQGQSKAKAEQPPTAQKLEPVPDSELKADMRVQMKLGTRPVTGSVVVVEKNEAQVQLDSGMTVKVPVADLYRG